MVIKIIPIRNNPIYIVVTQFDNTCQYHYHLKDLTTVNKYVDRGVWKIKTEI